MLNIDHNDSASRSVVDESVPTSALRIYRDTVSVTVMLGVGRRTGRPCARHAHGAPSRPPDRRAAIGRRRSMPESRGWTPAAAGLQSRSNSSGLPR